MAVARTGGGRVFGPDSGRLTSARRPTRVSAARVGRDLGLFARLVRVRGVRTHVTDDATGAEVLRREYRQAEQQSQQSIRHARRLISSVPRFRSRSKRKLLSQLPSVLSPSRRYGSSPIPAKRATRVFRVNPLRSALLRGSGQFQGDLRFQDERPSPRRIAPADLLRFKQFGDRLLQRFGVFHHIPQQSDAIFFRLTRIELCLEQVEPGLGALIEGDLSALVRFLGDLDDLFQNGDPLPPSSLTLAGCSAAAVGAPAAPRGTHTRMTSRLISLSSKRPGRPSAGARNGVTSA